MSGLRRSPVGTALTTGMRMTRQFNLSVGSRASVSVTGRRSREKRNRLSVTDGPNAEQLRKVSRILLVIPTTGY
jgi:hypothetical protein